MSVRFNLVRAARILRAGGVVCHATEGVFGLACDPLDVGAVDRVLRIKRRTVDKGLLLIADRFESLSSWIDEPTDAMRSALESCEQPTTWIVPASRRVPYWITGGKPGVGVRLVMHAQARALCRQVGGPLVSTSANRAGRAPATTYLRALLSLGADVDVVLPGHTDPALGPSRIINWSDGVTVR